MIKILTNLHKSWISCGLIMFSLAGQAQTDSEVSKIIADYDLQKLKNLERIYAEQFTADKQRALAAARINNWPEFKKNADGSVDELMKLAADGSPIYYSTQNLAAAVSTRASFLQSIYNLKGQGMVARVWDGGKVRASHQEFGNRVSVLDATAGPTGNNFHATHVTGTVVASGVVANARGMAPMATARTYNWTNDLSEATAEVQQGMLLSNHSYGVPSTSVPGWYIGKYNDDARAWDELAYNAPYYLAVVSAGNNGTDTNPQAMTSGYDKLTGNKVAKNNLVVANAQDANISANGIFLGVNINSGSSQGPADDFRIKPDIAGNGSNLFSTFEQSDNDYGSISGTSMAAPNVMGTLLLVQQQYNITNQKFMKAATLKALACHTADDAGNPGPDAVFGWGLLNGLKAVDVILGNGMSSVISEETLLEGQTFSFTVSSDGLSPLQATIAWTDVPGNLPSGTLNSTTPALVNDLDIRISNGTNVYYPWRLSGSASAPAVRNGDNSVDNIENIDIDLPFGTYTISVTHKGILQGGKQDFAIIVTGVNSQFAITPASAPQTVCSSGSAQFNFNYNAQTFEPTNFTVSGLPAGATASLSESQMFLPGVLTVTVSNLGNVPAGEYNFTVTGTNSTESESETATLIVLTPDYPMLNLISPLNLQEGLSTSLTLRWQKHINAQSFRVQVSTDPNFNSFVINESTTADSWFLKGLSESTVYYWRVLPSNLCGTATTNTTYRFDTGSQTCGITFTATDFANASIASSANAFAYVPVTVSGGFTVGQLTVSLNMSHTYIEDTMIYLEGPEEIGAPVITLFEEPCGDNDNIIATISDNGAPFVCGTSPGIGGTVLPKEPLSTFYNLPATGVWTLYVVDGYNGDGGMINSFALNFCNVTSANLSTPQAETLKMAVYPNPARDNISIQLPRETAGKTVLNLYDIQGRLVQSHLTFEAESSINVSSVEEGIYILTATNETFSISHKVVVKK